VSAAIRRFWDTGNFSPLTKNNRVTVTDAHVCFVGHITYEELVKRLEQSEYATALASRILWICVRRPKIVAIPESIPVVKMLHYGDEVAKAIQFSSDVNELSLSAASLELWGTLAVFGKSEFADVRTFACSSVAACLHFRFAGLHR